jgi:glycosyltransferase involved in cell wall biosynthesis
MRIAHVVNTMQVGGAEVLVAGLCRTLRELGHDISVHCISGNGAVGEQLQREGLAVYAHRFNSRVRRTWQLMEAFRKLRPDAVHCHNVAPTVVGAPAARLARVASVVSTRHSLVAPPHIMRDELQYSLAARCCDYVVGVCQATCMNLRNLPLSPAHKIRCIYNAAARPRPAYDLSSRKTGFTLIHVARLAAIKDQETLLRAFAIAKKNVPNASLWIVGDGTLRSRLEQLATELGVAPAVTFFGEQADVGPYLTAADTFIISSVSEGLPMALLEAMSTGLPAIVTDVGGMPEVVRMAGSGAIVPPGNPYALATEICCLANDPTTLKKWGAQARNSYEQNFAPARMAERYLQLYRGQLEAAAGTS